ncbi:CAMK family protein kinase [Tritrichomonas foetus]|uniref:CAMK family protein kinase n=1 Tax=Tritrichomonas foetus TaxID=1144522 RepID=A0A1J4J082_9EUKA|nr:CAMK family protein kinase [Tritrichomonas foetus]|eukprot:OHS92834.1 CAMK family protein kinase [Tritrichomonas foetus]
MESRFENEIRILQKLDHPNITVLFDMLKDTVNYYVIMELCSTGTLFDYIIEHRKMPEDDGKYVFKQIMTTLKYMQSEGIAHRDIKPENILIDDKLHIKFIDFGFSDVQIQNHLMRTRCGSSAYASPECLNGGPYNGLISDIWSAGVVLYTMLNGKLPWTKDNLVQLTRQISDAEFFIPTNLSDDVRDLINGMMNADVQKRYTVDQILDHPWLKTVQDPDFTNECHIKKSLGQEEVNSFFSLIPSVSANQIFNKSHLVDLSSIRSDTMHDGRCLLAMAKRRKLTRKRCVVPILTSHRNNLSCAQLL